MSDVTHNLNPIEASDAHAATQLLPLAYDELSQLAAAQMSVKDWDWAVELNPLAEQAGLRASRASSRLKAGVVTEAVAEVAELMKLSN